MLLFHEVLYQNLYFTLQNPSLEEELRGTLAHAKRMVELQIQKLCGGKMIISGTNEVSQ